MRPTEINSDLLRKAIDASASSIVIADASKAGMPLIYVNRTFQTLTGYSTKEILGKNCRFMQSSDRRQLGRKTIREAIRKQRACLVTLRNYRKNGTMFWNELYLSPVFDPKGKLTHYIGVQTDVTARIEAEQKLEHHLKNLEVIVKERTKSLEEKNIALKEILGQLEVEKKSLQDRLTGNIDTVLIPLIRRLMSKHGVSTGLSKGLQALENGLLETTSSFGLGISRKLHGLSPREIEVCNLVKSGLSTKRSLKY